MIDSSEGRTFINQAFEKMLKSTKWGFPLKLMFEWVIIRNEDDEFETIIADVDKSLPEARDHMNKYSINWLKLFQKIESCNNGSVILGRRTHPTRFRWAYNPLELAKESLLLLNIKQRSIITPFISDSIIEHSAEKTYMFPLRHDAKAVIRVPDDISADELIRLSEFIKLLPGR